MPSSYTRNLLLEKPATGEQAGTWGETANNDYDSIDTAIDGNDHLPISSVLETGLSPDSTGRNKVIVWEGNLTQPATVNITPDSAKKLYFMTNATTGGFAITFVQGGGGSYTLAPGAAAIIYCNGEGSNAKVDGALTSPQFGSVVVASQVSGTSLIKTQASPTANSIQFWKDAAPAAAASIGLSIPGGVLGNDLVFATYAPTVWTERLRIRSADGQIDAKGLLNVLQREVANSNVVSAAYNAAAIEIRETNLVEGAQTGIAYAPRIAFTWKGVGPGGAGAAAQIGMDSIGILKAMNPDGTLGPFQCSVFSVTTINATTVNAGDVHAESGGINTFVATTVSADHLKVSTIDPLITDLVITAPTVNVTGTLNAPNIAGVATLAVTTLNASAVNTATVNASGLISTASADNGTAAITKVYATSSTDTAIRYYTLANFAAQIKPFIPGGYTVQTPVGRVINTDYPNTSGRAMAVTATINLSPGGSITATSGGTAVGTAANIGGAATVSFTLAFVVLAGNSYRFVFNSGPATIGACVEWT